jgi:phenylpyruvate tautomerase PptA (4-oxalocrotonate tautomerase family)
MPYMRITCAELTSAQRTAAAVQLTNVINELFYHSRASLTRDELRERTTVHFIPYAPDTLFIGGRTPMERGVVDLTVELSDWAMSVRQQRKIAHTLTPVLAEIFNVPTHAVDGITIRFHSYPPTDFAVGGRLLSDRVPRIGQLAKRLFG